MKKVILTSVIALLGFGAFAQTTTPPKVNDKQVDMKDLRKDIRDKRQDERQKVSDRKSGNKLGVKTMGKDIKRDNKDIKADARDLNRDGVKHPIRHADRQIHKQNLHHRH
jgi:hypothetical protein